MSVFRFKQFSVKQEQSAMKVGTDAMLLGALVESNSPKQILDIGSGTGVISLMLAQRFSEAKILAIEIDLASYMEALENFQNSNWMHRLSAHHSDFLEFNSDQQFDCIVSNPPYFQTRLENNDVRKSQARHESALPMKQMISNVSKILNQQGSFWVIVPSEVAVIWQEASMTERLYLNSNISIRGKEGGAVKRQILQFNKFSSELNESELTIRHLEGSYTRAYIELTKEFHYNDLSKSK